MLRNELKGHGMNRALDCARIQSVKPSRRPATNLWSTQAYGFGTEQVSQM
jgi:hypothetical protein